MESLAIRCLSCWLHTRTHAGPAVTAVTCLSSGWERLSQGMVLVQDQREELEFLEKEDIPMRAGPQARGRKPRHGALYIFS